MALPGLSWLIGSAGAASGRVHWLAAGAGLLSTTVCGAVILNQPLGTILQASGAGESGAAVVEPLFGVTDERQSRLPGRIQFLTGINGEISASERHLAGDEILSETGRSKLPIALAALDGLPPSNCLTVTTKNGEKFSFRILGVHPQTGTETGKAMAELELAIASCSNIGDSVSKAVIASDAPPAAKRATPERSL